MKNKKISAFSLIELSIVIMIIGVLVAGVIQGSRLVAQFRLSSAKSMTQSSPINSIKDLVFWFEATSDESIDDSQKEEGSEVTTWYDINPQAMQKSNATSATAPTYKADCINGLPCLKFDGTSQYLEILNDHSYSSQMMGFFVINNLVLTTSANRQYILSSFRSGTSSLQFYTGSGLSIAYLNSAETGGLGFGYSFAMAENNNAIVAFSNNGSAQRIYFTLPGVTIGNRSATNSTGKMYLNNGVGIGAHYNNIVRSGFFNGYIAEVVLFNRVLRAEERTSIIKYLSDKWSIKI